MNFHWFSSVGSSRCPIYMHAHIWKWVPANIAIPVKAAAPARLECVRTLIQARKSVYVYTCSKQTVNSNFHPGIGQKEVFASAVAFSGHLCRVVWCVWTLITTVRWNNNEFMNRVLRQTWGVTEWSFKNSPSPALMIYSCLVPPKPVEDQTSR